MLYLSLYGHASKVSSISLHSFITYYSIDYVE